jgi:hypothetical protein
MSRQPKERKDYSRVSVPDDLRKAIADKIGFRYTRADALGCAIDSRSEADRITFCIDLLETMPLSDKENSTGRAVEILQKYRQSIWEEVHQQIADALGDRADELADAEESEGPASLPAAPSNGNGNERPVPRGHEALATDVARLTRELNDAIVAANRNKLRVDVAARRVTGLMTLTLVETRSFLPLAED